MKQMQCLHRKTFEFLKDIKCKKPVNVLCGPNSQPLTVVGQVAVQLPTRVDPVRNLFMSYVDDLKRFEK